MEEVKKRIRVYFKDNTEFVSSHSMLFNDVLTIVHTNGLYTIRVHANNEKKGFTYLVDYKAGNVKDYILYMKDIDNLDDLEDSLTELQMRLGEED